ncbi:UMP kinase [Candidatus Curtissbacteria bacterium]|nr:UMP kinase [Candidatus Curtissbacteria bacterium]
MERETIIIKLGGSLIVPAGGLDVPYISAFYHFIRKQVAENKRRFFILIGGGLISRHYRDAGATITGHELSRDDLDWLGIHATRLNAHLFRTIFRDMAHPLVIHDYDFIQKPEKPIVIAAGWKPGWSTDYDAVILAQDYHIGTIVKMSDVDCVYDKDPNKYSQAKAIETISWADYRAMIGDEWIPGLRAPFDPVAAKLAQDISATVYFLNGRKLENVEKAISNEKFLGTIIKPDRRV